MSAQAPRGDRPTEQHLDDALLALTYLANWMAVSGRPEIALKVAELGDVLLELYQTVFVLPAGMEYWRRPL